MYRTFIRTEAYVPESRTRGLRLLHLPAPFGRRGAAADDDLRLAFASMLFARSFNAGFSPAQPIARFWPTMAQGFCMRSTRMRSRLDPRLAVEGAAPRRALAANISKRTTITLRMPVKTARTHLIRKTDYTIEAARPAAVKNGAEVTTRQVYYVTTQIAITTDRLPTLHIQLDYHDAHEAPLLEIPRYAKEGTVTWLFPCHLQHPRSSKAEPSAYGVDLTSAATRHCDIQ